MQPNNLEQTINSIQLPYIIDIGIPPMFVPIVFLDFAWAKAKRKGKLINNIHCFPAAKTSRMLVFSHKSSQFWNMVGNKCQYGFCGKFGSQEFSSI